MDEGDADKNRSPESWVWLFMKVEFIKIIERPKKGEWREDGGGLPALVLRLVLRSKN